jgi:hypothetical protein
MNEWNSEILRIAQHRPWIRSVLVPVAFYRVHPTQAVGSFEILNVAAVAAWIPDSPLTRHPSQQSRIQKILL